MAPCRHGDHNKRSRRDYRILPEMSVHRRGAAGSKEARNHENTRGRKHEKTRAAGSAQAPGSLPTAASLSRSAGRPVFIILACPFVVSFFRVFVMNLSECCSGRLVNH